MKTLSLHDRLNIISFLPDQDDYETMKIVVDLALKLSLQEEEEKTLIRPHKKNGFQVTEAGEVWTGEFDFTEAETKYITDRLVALNQARAIKKNLFPLYEMFVVTP